jgi:drug/metabolite transporter (DMT)-like permease
VVWYRALRGHSATSAALVQLLVPVLAAIAGVLALGEAATPRLFLAGALTLGGVALAVLGRERYLR